jgi:putative ABC transport system permease protein
VMTAFRSALISLRRAPGLAIAAVVCLALGAAATTAVSTLVGALLFRPLPFPDADRLVRVWFDEPNVATRISLSIPEFEDFASVPAFELFVGTARVRVVALFGNGAERLRGEAVSPSYFEMLGLQPFLGRVLNTDDHAAGAPPALVLSHGAWMRFFGSDPAIVGRELRTARAVYTIVGVASPGFDGTVEDDIVEFFIPLQHYEPRALQTDRMSRPAWAIARLAPGRTLAEATAQVASVGATLASRYPDIYGRYRTHVEPMGESWRESLRRGGGLLFLASAALLVIAAINVGCLLLARVLDRRRELAIRTSLGADRRRVMTQLFLEAVVLVAAGGAAGAVAGPWLLDAFLALSPVALPHYVALTPDAWTLSATIFTLAVAGLMAGTVPALVGRRVEPSDVLRESGRGTLGRVREQRWTTVLIAAETALTLVLLIAGGLLLRTFTRLDTLDLGYDRDRIARLAVTLNPTDVGGTDRLPAMYARLREAIARHPGVAQVGLVTTTLPPWDADRARVTLQDGPIDPGSRGLEAGIHPSDEGLLPMLGARIVAGRNISAADAPGTAPVAVISRALARHVGGPERALGRMLHLQPDEPRGTVRDFRIVGVVEDIAFDGLREQDTRRYIRYGDDGDPRAARYDVYLSLAQNPTTVVSIGVSTPGDPGAMIAPIRQVIGSVAPASAVHWTSTMREEVGLEYAASRFYSMIVVLFSASALAVTSVGLFALLSHAASRRISEMGLRLALGATPRSTAVLLLRTGLWPIGAGIAAGLVGAAFASRFLQGLLYGIGPFDGATFAGAVASLAAVALAAAIIPARRVASIDPVTSLRAD